MWGGGKSGDNLKGLPIAINQLLEEEAAFEIRDAAKAFWSKKTDHIALVELQLDVFSKKKHLNRPALEFFFNCLLFYLEQDQKLDLSSLQLRLALLQAIDLCKISVDPALLLEKTILQLQKSLSNTL